MEPQKKKAIRRKPQSERQSLYDILSFGGFPVKQSSLDEIIYTPSETLFSLWAPSAQKVRLRIYPDGAVTKEEEDQKRQAQQEEDMLLLDRQSDGSWTGTIKRDLLGKFCTFQIKYKGRWLKETPGINAKAVGLNGQRAAIIDLGKTDPEGWEEDHRPEYGSYGDIILYELHHRDFSIDKDSGIAHKGKYLALTQEGTRTTLGELSGTDHLLDLGITHVHLLPSFDFDADELKDGYNWGYDPLNYNVPEGSYSTDPADPYSRIREFKKMVQSLHRRGICVVMDVVFNHTSRTADSNFNLTVPGYFYRHTENGKCSNGSGCGNETASERPMARRFILESILYWIKEYHIDGFRFDLMRIHDIATMNLIMEEVQKIDPGIFIYGEGWSSDRCAYKADRLCSKTNAYLLPGIAFFGDELRDGLRGPFHNEDIGGFLSGESGCCESVKFGIVGAILHKGISYPSVNHSKAPWAQSPMQMISYASCHDDMCLGDRLKRTLSGATPHQLQKAQMLAHAILLTSQGIPFLFAGEEFIRDKAMVHNSYNSPDEVNAIKWKDKTRNIEVYKYVKSLIALRKDHPALHMGNADAVRKNLQFIDTASECVIAFRIDGKACNDSWEEIIVIFNGSAQKPAEVELEPSSHVVVCEKGRIDPLGLRIISSDHITVEPTSAVIMYGERHRSTCYR